MKKVKFIYNPHSGDKKFLRNLDVIIRNYQKKDFEVIPYRLGNIDYDDIFLNEWEEYDHVLIAGGDGTVNIVINFLKRNNIDLPIAILPTGTANDFSKHIGMNSDISKDVKKILSSERKKIDLGKVGDKYFINVASTGFFTDVSQKIDNDLKKNLGKLAYYIKGVEQIPNFRPLNVNIYGNNISYSGDIYLILIFNGQTAGNIKLAYKSSPMDGLLDVVIFKSLPILDMIPVFIDVLKVEHLEDHQNGVLHFQTDNLTIECNEDIPTDIDGEKGPGFPLNITCEKDSIELLGYDGD